MSYRTELLDESVTQEINQIEQGLRLAVDPSVSLPQITLEPYAQGYWSKYYYLVNQSGYQLGKAAITKLDTLKEDNFMHIRIFDTSFRNEGYGTATYLRAIALATSHGHDFKTDSQGVSAAAIKVWRSLGKAGLVEGLETPVTPIDSIYFRANYRVTPSRVTTLLHA